MKKWILFALIPIVGVAWFSSSSELESNDLLENRIWISHMPQHERDKFSVFALIEEEHIGLFQNTSLFQGDYDASQYKIEGERIHIQMLQNKKKSTARFKAEKCNQKGFDYCLELSGTPRGPKRYYSLEGMEIKSESDIGKFKQQLADSLE